MLLGGGLKVVRERAQVTLVDVAREAGVSKSTVSLALQGSSSIRAETTAAVAEAARRLGYVYNRGAANLRRSRSNIVGLVINDLTNPFFAEMVVGVEQVFRSAGYVSFIANTADSVLRQDEVLRAMREQGVAGLIASPARGSRKGVFEDFIRGGIPVVTAMRRLPGSRAVAVSPRNEEGALEAVRHLLSLGHRTIGFVGGYGDMSVHADRLAGYRAALVEAKLPATDDLVVEGEVSRKGGSEGLASLMASHPEMTAVLCFNDVVAFGAMLHLRRIDRRVGEGFAVVGFDDLPEAALYTPTLTTVRLDARSLGERAAQSMLRMVEGGKVQGEDYATAVQLVVRESCGAPADRRTRGDL